LSDGWEVRDVSVLAKRCGRGLSAFRMVAFVAATTPAPAGPGRLRVNCGKGLRVAPLQAALPALPQVSSRHHSLHGYSPHMKLLRLLVVSVLVGFTTLSALAQATKVVPDTTLITANVTTNKLTKHCLWEVKGKTNTVFLLGSMHVMKDEMYPLAPEIEAAYKRAGVVAFETDIKVLESPTFAMKLMGKATYPEGESLKKNLSPAMYSLLASNLQNSLLSVEMINQFKPWMAAMTLVVLELQKQGFNLQNGVDKHYFARAVEDKKALDHFESPDFQAELFTGLTDKESEEFLGQALKDMDVWKKQIALLEKAWLTGDTAALDKLLLDSFREYPLMHKKLLIDRNRAWISKLEQFLKGDKDVLVVVGAGHLVGKDSVVELITAKGYQPEQR